MPRRTWRLLSALRTISLAAESDFPYRSILMPSLVIYLLDRVNSIKTWFIDLTGVNFSKSLWIIGLETYVNREAM